MFRDGGCRGNGGRENVVICSLDVTDRHRSNLCEEKEEMNYYIIIIEKSYYYF